MKQLFAFILVLFLSLPLFTYATTPLENGSNLPLVDSVFVYIQLDQETANTHFSYYKAKRMLYDTLEDCGIIVLEPEYKTITLQDGSKVEVVSNGVGVQSLVLSFNTLSNLDKTVKHTRMDLVIYDTAFIYTDKLAIIGLYLNNNSGFTTNTTNYEHKDYIVTMLENMLDSFYVHYKDSHK